MFQYILVVLFLIFGCFLFRGTSRISISTNKLIFVIKVTIFAGLLLTYTIYGYWQKQIRIKEIRQYTIVVSALDKYKHDNGRYPHELSELVPDYIKILPGGSKLLGIDDLFYESFGPNIKSKWNDEIFIGKNVPPYTLTLWGSGGISSDTVIRYCPVQYDCRHEIGVTTRVNGEWIQQKEIFDAKRIDDVWVQLRNY